MTTWRVSHYDVWGNTEDGYEVNDVFRGDEFLSPQNETGDWTDSQIKEALDLRADLSLDTDGDDIVITVEDADTGYPLGEIQRVDNNPTEKGLASVNDGFREEQK